jgi:hypothetical protein
MTPAPIPQDEDLRIKDLYTFGILDTTSEKEFDDLVELASQICKCPIAMISFVDKERQWFKAKKNVTQTQSDRASAFCAHTILSNEILLVTDAKTDERFAENPNVTGKMQIGFYAGAPIISAAGHRLGSVCVIDNIKRQDLSAEQLRALEIIAAQVSQLLDLRLKNKLLIRHTNAQLEAEKRISQLTVAEADKKDGMIAYELQENLAQSLASARLFLDSIGSSRNSQEFYIDKSKDIITNIIVEIKALSRSISPTTYQYADYFSEIEAYMNEFGELNNIEVKFGVIDIQKKWNRHIGLHLFKIIQNQLAIALNRSSTQVTVNITSVNGINLIIEEKTNLLSNQITADALHDNIVTRVGLMKGKITMKTNHGIKILDINIPLAPKQIKTK